MKLRLIKITPTGHDPEIMVVTDGSTAHTMVQDYAKDNAYPIEEKSFWCSLNTSECRLESSKFARFACVLQDLKRIEDTIVKYAPILLKLPALDNGEPYNDHLSQCFSNIEIACELFDEEASEVEHEWLQPELPTYEEYTKGWSIEQKMEMCYEEDIYKSGDSDAPRKVWTYKDVAHAVDNADWLPDFEEKFKKYLQEREYIDDC